MDRRRNRSEDQVDRTLVKITVLQITVLHIKTPQRPTAHALEDVRNQPGGTTLPCFLLSPFFFPTWCKQLPRYERMAWICTLDCPKPQLHDYRFSGKLRPSSQAGMGSTYSSELHDVCLFAAFRQTASIFLFDKHRDNVEMMLCVM